MSTGLALGATVLLLVLNAFFVAAEFALVSARRAGIEPYAEAGSRRAATTLRAMERVGARPVRSWVSPSVRWHSAR